MNSCEYCGRGMYLSEGDTCKGCGSPFPPVHQTKPAMMYDPRVFDMNAVKDFGRPGTNIPIVDYYMDAVGPLVRAYFEAREG